MTDTLLEQIKADRENGTPGKWALTVESCGDWEITDQSGDVLFLNTDYYPYVSENEADARRIARVPDIEARILRGAETIKAAEALADVIERMTTRKVSPVTGGRTILEVDVAEAENKLAAFRATQEKSHDRHA